MNKDTYNLYSAYRSIHENVASTSQTYTQESLNQMDVSQLQEIYKQRRAYREQLQLTTLNSTQRINPIRL